MRFLLLCFYIFLTYPAISQIVSDSSGRNTSANNEVPDWNLMEVKLTGQYGQDSAFRIINKQKYSWYKKRNMLDETIKYGICYFDGIVSRGITTWEVARQINNFSYEYIFERNTSTAQLTTAREWMVKVLEFDPNVPDNMDTYANILYKLSLTQEAIAAEQKAIGLLKGYPLPKEMIDETSAVFNNNLNKMLNGNPTWKY